MSQRNLKRQRRATRLGSPYRAERLEPRIVLAAFPVLNTLDSGAGSLRQAILDANAAATADTITFGPAFATAQTISLLTALPQFSAAGGALTITGTGASLLTVRRDPSAATDFRILDSQSAALTISGMTVAGGKATGDYGGGLRINEPSSNVTLDGVAFTGNNAGAGGGGIFVQTGATLAIRNSSVTGNTATNGAGIYFFTNGSLLMESSLVAGNTNSAGQGAGLYFYGAASATPPAGFSPNTLVVRNSTFSGNKASANGGGAIALVNFVGELFVQNSTITGNSSDATGGGGIRLGSGPGTITLFNSIVSGNAGFANPDIQSIGQVLASCSAIGSNAGFTFAGASSNNLAPGTDLKLGPVADNGGPTLSRLPQPGSPLINGGLNSHAPSGPNDQRGPGFVRVFGGVVDIGAVELQPRTIIVTTGADSGPGSLRKAITDANANASMADTITFSAAFSSQQTISLLTPLPSITDSLTITGPGASLLTLRRDPGAASNFRVLASEAPEVTLTGMTLTGGGNENEVGGGLGAGSASGFHVTLDSVVVRGNSGNLGGGIYIAPDGFLTLRNSTVAENNADQGAGIGFLSSGSLLMENSTVSGNVAGYRAGGIYFGGSPSHAPPTGFTPDALVIRNSTIANNAGGAVLLEDSDGTLLLQDSTVSGNSYGGDNGIAGGITNRVGSGSITLTNSIVSGNNDPNIPDIRCSAYITANFSAIGSNLGFTLSDASGNNLPFGTDLKLSPLGNFGGPTQTMLPAFGSPLFNAGSNALVPAGVTTDQRGVGFTRIAVFGVDIGAVEAQSQILVSNAGDTGPGSLRQAITDANASPAFDTIVFDPTFFNTPRTISLLSRLPSITDPLTIAGPGAGLLTVRHDPGVATDFRVFGSAAAVVNLFSMTLSGGSETTSYGAGFAAGGPRGFQATLDGVVLTGNSAFGSGGIDIAEWGFLTLRNSTVSGNSVYNEGGGIGMSDHSSLLMENSTLSGNTVTGNGGSAGLFFFGGASTTPPVGFVPGTLVIRNSTIVGNNTGNSGGSGGGIGLGQFTGTLLLQNSTVTGNTVNSPFPFNFVGGGISLGSGTGTITLLNSVVSGNLNPNGTTGISVPDISSINPVIANFSAIGSNAGFTLSGSSGNNVPFGADPKLGPLADNGGPTKTVLPLAGSPLLNAGSNALVPAVQTADQRGAGFARVSGAAVDIGAVEVQPRNFVVTTPADAGPGSLRQAITDANANSAATDSITFGGAFLSPQTITLLSPLPDITDSLAIQGNSTASRLIVRRDPGASDFRIFTSSAGTLVLTNLTISGGRATGIGGGGLYVTAGSNNLLDGVVLSGNSATSVDTGGGGGIAVGTDAYLTVRNSTLSGNTAVTGGGIYFGHGGNLVLENSTVSGNTVTGFAGGVYFYGAAGTFPQPGFTPGVLLVRNSTIAGNSAGVSGGGILTYDFTGFLILASSTVTGNTANGATGGGGISRIGPGTGTMTLFNSVVAGNANPNSPDIKSNNPVHARFSAIGSDAGFSFDSVDSSNLPFGTVLKLGPLADNGGPTRTILPQPGSPLINAGSNALTPPLTTDQRGAGFDRAVGGVVDIGAVETRYITVTNADDAGSGSLRQAITDANAAPGADAVAFDPAFFGQPRTISLLSALPTVTDPLSIIGNSIAQNLIVRRDPSAATQFRIVHSTASALNLSNLTITGGRNADYGGGVFFHANGSNNLLDGVIITGNTTKSDGHGGGVALDVNAFLTVRNSTISGNTSGSAGGGVYFYSGGSLVMENSTVSGNSAGGAGGGGIFFFGDASASPPAGFTTGTLVIRNSTIARNVTDSSGGGIELYRFNGTLALQNATVTENTAGQAGGIARVGDGTGTIALSNSIVSGNNVANPIAPDIFSNTSVSAIFSAIGSDQGFALANGTGPNLPFGEDLMLSPLGNFGGPTQTILPLYGSPLIDAGLVTPGVASDQRGAGYTRSSGGGVDIGAAESQNYVLVSNANDANAGSLRQAILNANASPAFDTIVFDPNFFSSPRTISLLSALPDATGQLSILGNSTAARLTVRRDPGAATTFRVLTSGASTLNLSQLTISGGRSTDLGGGILAIGNSNNLFDGVVVTDNVVTGPNVVGGGGIALFHNASLTLRNSTVSGNNTVTAGGGVYFYTDGALLVENSTISGNSGDTGAGGGIYFFGSASANPPLGFVPGTLVVRNSTIADNRAVAGGGIELRTSPSALLLQNSTVTGNSATGSNADDGGGIQLRNATGALTVSNSVVSGNTGAYGQDISATTPVLVTFSAVGIEDGFPLAPASGNNLPYNTPLLLGPLANNGGPTQTRLPQSGSPLINAGSAALLPAAMVGDQRGFARIVGAAPDIGAVESPVTVTPPTLSSIAINGGAAQRSQVKTITLTFDRAVILAAGAASLVRLNTGGSGANDNSAPTNASAVLTAAPTSSDGVTWVYTFVGGNPFMQTSGGNPTGSLVDGIYTVSVDPTKVTDSGVPMAAGGSLTFHRLFGDNNGNKNVNATDYNAFRSAFGKPSPDPAYNPTFDFDNNGNVNATDYNQFRTRFGKSLAY